MVQVFKTGEESSKIYSMLVVFLRRVISLEKPVIDRLADHLENVTFSDFQYGFRLSCLTAAVSDKIARAFKRCGATRAVAVDISRGFDRVCHANILYKLEFCGISDLIRDLIAPFLGYKRFRVVLDGKPSQEYPVNVSVLQDSILIPKLFLLCINNFSDDAIYDVAIYDGHTVLYCKCYRTGLN